MDADLCCTGIFAHYGGPDIVCGLTASFPAGQLSVILGENGAGKSTLLRVLAGFITPRQGDVQLAGRNLFELAPRARARLVASVPQVVMEPVPLLVAEVVALGRYSESSWGGNGINDGGAVNASLHTLGITGLAQRRCDTLSGGEWRKVLVGQGLAQQAFALLLDEPTAFLDPPSQYSLMRKLRQHAAKTNTVVLAVLHDPTLAKQCADTVLLLRAGKVLCHGEPKQVLTPELLCETYGCKTPWWEENS